VLCLFVQAILNFGKYALHALGPYHIPPWWQEVKADLMVPEERRPIEVVKSEKILP
jgi:hypothetical protein